MKIDVKHSEIMHFHANGKPMRKSKLLLSIKTKDASLHFSLSPAEGVELAATLQREAIAARAEDRKSATRNTV